MNWLTIGLLALIVLIPYVERLQRISFGEFEMELRSEIDKTRKEVDERLKESDNKDSAPSKPRVYRNIDHIYDLLDEEPLAAIGNIRLEIQILMVNLLEAEGIEVEQGNSITLLRKLEEEVGLSEDMSHSVRNVVNLCNKALHQGTINEDEAIDIVELGVDVISFLHSYYHEVAISPVETTVIEPEEAEKYRNAQYRVTSVVPLVDSPKLQVRTLNQAGIYELLDGYEEYAEFLVEINSIDR